MGRNVEKITVDRQEGRLPQDLERYRQMALNLGAAGLPLSKPRTSRWTSGWC